MVHSFEPGDASVEASHATSGVQPDIFVQYTNARPEINQKQSENLDFLPELSISSDKKSDISPNGDRKNTVKIIQKNSDEICKLPPSDAVLRKSVTSLGDIARNNTLIHKLSDDAGRITAESVENALLVDSRLRDPDGPNENGPDKFLTDSQREDAIFLRDHLDELTDSEGIAVKKLGRFKSFKLAEKAGEIVGKKIADSAIGAVAGKGLSKLASQILCNAIRGARPDLDPKQAEKPSSYATNTSTLKPRDLKEASNTVFDRIDTDNNGYMSKKELANAVAKGNYKGQEAQTIASLYKNIRDIEELSNDEFGDENDGITKADLRKFEETNTNKEDISKDLRNADRFNNNKFGQIDKNNDGFLTEAELDKALQAKGLSKTDKDFLERLKDDKETIQYAHDDVWYPYGDSKGITKNDIKDYYDHWTRSGDEAKLIGSVSWMLHRTSLSQRPSISRDLYSQKDPLDSITPDAIDQGTIGDCYFLAALAAVAKQNPQQIKDMIKDNKNGTYTVTFPERPDDPVTVTAPTDAELGLYNGGSKYGVWVPVMEKAYGKYKQEHHHKGGLTPSEGADGGGWSRHALKTLTGRNTDKYEMRSESEKELTQLLEKAFTSEPPKEVTANVMGYESKGKGKKSPDGFPSKHAYTIVGFKPDGKGGGTVTVRNPWGNGNNTTSGTIDISVEKFKRNFTQLIVSK